MSLWWCTHTFRPSGKRMTVLHDGKRCTAKRQSKNCVLYNKGWDFKSCRSAGAVVRVGGRMRETRSSKIKKAPKRKRR